MKRMAQTGVEHIRGPQAVFECLQSLGDADGEPLVPLSEREVAGIQGRYVFGPAMNQQVVR